MVALLSIGIWPEIKIRVFLEPIIEQFLLEAPLIPDFERRYLLLRH
jgi:hypothetical protein